ncbi:hypothetical protein B566_EDAN015592 [Ephemera danica]|nr:hypothetical protein B566_EDAN015592 [Ephemera danica]
MKPSCILIFSGKRKCGKDFLTESLLQRIGHDKATIVRLSAPIKSHWAKSHNLDLTQLLDSSSYKEQHRLDMIHWSEEERAKDYGCFCRTATQEAQKENKAVWIVSDARRKTDLRWFRENFGSRMKTIRVTADDDVRSRRGWVFTKGVDDVSSECDLDDVDDWDLKVSNNGGIEELEDAVKQLTDWATRAINS